MAEDSRIERQLWFCCSAAVTVDKWDPSEEEGDSAF